MKNAVAENQTSPPWDDLEAGHRAWHEFPPLQQERIVRHYSPKIRFLALRIKSKLPKNVELGELISAGTLGLMEALGKFEPQYGIRFETYAENRIRGAMLDELRRLDWFPRSLRHKVRVLDEVMQHIEHEKGRPATEEELQACTGFELKDIRQALEALQSQLWVSLDAIQDNVGNENPVNNSEPYTLTASAELIARLIPLINNLTDREKLVLSLYYAEEMNMRETAEIMGITEGRVSQLHSQALARLRRNFHKMYGEAHTSEEFI